MNPSDAWYVRLPDTRVVRASSTRAVRHHIESGEIPPGSLARKSSLETWTPLHRIEAFADLISHNEARRKESHGEKDSARNLKLQTVGVGGLITELTNALDSSLIARKLRIASYSGFFAGLVLFANELIPLDLQCPWTLARGGVICLLMLVIAGIASALLSQLTFIELSRLRPAREKEVAEGLGRNATRVFFCFLVVFGSILSLLAFSYWLPGFLLVVEGPEYWLPGFLLVVEGPDWLMEAREVLACFAVVFQLLVQILLIPLLGFSLLLGAIVIVEECNFARALLQWLELVRRNLNRLFIYEALTAAVALIITTPLVFPVVLAEINAPTEGPPAMVAHAFLWVLKGLSLTPAIAYLIVANVFIYLHIRYEQPPASQ